jgi:hypothetical protein
MHTKKYISVNEHYLKIIPLIHIESIKMHFKDILVYEKLHKIVCLQHLQLEHYISLR